MSEEKTANELLLNVATLIEEVQTEQEEIRKARQDLANHEISANPHGLTNPNSKIYATIKSVVREVLTELAENGKIKLVDDAQ